MNYYMNAFKDAISRAGLSEEAFSMEWCLGSFAIFSMVGESVAIFSKIRFGKVGKPLVRTPVKFDRLELFDVAIPPKKALEALCLEQFSALSGRSVIFPRNPQWACLTPEATWYSHNPERNPCYLFGKEDLGTMTPNDPQGNHIFAQIPAEVKHTILNGTGDESFYSVVDAVDWWMGRNISLAQHGDFTRPGMEVTFPLLPGNVIRVFVKQGAFFAHIEPGGVDDIYHAKLAFRLGNEFFWETVPVIGGEASFSSLPGNDFLITTLLNTVAISTYKGERRFIEHIREMAIQEDRYRSLLSNGERETCEYKELIDHKDGSVNWFIITDDLPRIMSGMANALGGSIFIGVSDDGDIIGINNGYEEMKKKWQCDSDGMVKERLVASLKRSMSNHRSNAPVCDYRWYNDGRERDVLVVEVAKNPPTVVSELKESEYWVRRGTSKYRARLEEITALLAGDS